MEIYWDWFLIVTLLLLDLINHYSSECIINASVVAFQEAEMWKSNSIFHSKLRLDTRKPEPWANKQELEGFPFYQMNF